MRFAIILTLLLVAFRLEAAPPVRHLFLDPAFLTESEGVQLRVNPPQRREVVIRADKPWEKLMISFYLTVLDDPETGTLRLWYICRDAKNRPNVAYAESTDGLTWKKPNLGIVDYEGSRDNNLVGLSSLEGAVYRDEQATTPEERYVYLTHLITKGMVRFHSPDGLHWKEDDTAWLPFGADSQAIAFRQPTAAGWAVYLRGWTKRDDGSLYRTVVRAMAPDLTTPLPIRPSEDSRRLWGKDKVAVIGDEFPTVLATDATDPENSDVYTNSIAPYPPDPRWLVGFPSFFQREKSRGDGRLEVQCVGSRDGMTWHRYDRASYAAPGFPGTENANMMFIGPGLIVRGEEIWQYGTGFRSRHGDVAERKRQTDGVVYRFVQRIDGFVSADFDLTGGKASTRPVPVDGTSLRLNADTGALGLLRTGLADESGQAIPGFGLEDAVPFQGNATSAEIAWKSGASLASLRGKTVTVQFSGARAKVYGFRFEKTP
ncbi:MAG: hypothetical protein H7A52_00775 [Akkermansiaceae bacterium]|nr:hypothetical protein [Akkermansiaceae bacterium]